MRLTFTMGVATVNSTVYFLLLIALNMRLQHNRAAARLGEACGLTTLH